MEFPIAKFNYWVATLRNIGYVGSALSCHDICVFLLRNDFESLQHLEAAPAPDTWDGADQLPAGFLCFHSLPVLICVLCIQVICSLSSS
jgi:hypothetical protein